MLVTCASCKKPVFVSASMVAGGSASVSCQSCGTGLEVSPDGGVNVPGGAPAASEPAPSELPADDPSAPVVGTGRENAQPEPNLPPEPQDAAPEQSPFPTGPHASATHGGSSPGFDMPVAGVVTAAEPAAFSPLAPIAPPPHLEPLGVPPAPPPDFGPPSAVPVAPAPSLTSSSLDGPVPPPPPMPTLGVGGVDAGLSAALTPPKPSTTAPPPISQSDDAPLVHSATLQDQEVVAHTYGPERAAVDAVDVATSMPSGGGIAEAQVAQELASSSGILAGDDLEAIGDDDVVSDEVTAQGEGDAREAAEALLTSDGGATDSLSPFAPPPDPQPPVEPDTVAGMISGTDPASAPDGETWQATEPASAVPGADSPWNSGAPAAGTPAPGGAWSEPARASVAEHVPGLEGAPYDPVPWSGPRPQMPEEIPSQKSRRTGRRESKLLYIGGAAALGLVIVLAIVFSPGDDERTPPPDDGSGGVATAEPKAIDEPPDEVGGEPVDFGAIDAPDIDVDAQLPSPTKSSGNADAKLAALNLERRAPVARTKRTKAKGKRNPTASRNPDPPPPPQPPPPTAGGAGTGTKVVSTNSARQHYIQGNVYLQQKKVTLAIDELKKSIKQDPKNGLAYRSLGVAYYMLGRERSAMEAYGKFVRLAPSHKDVPKVKGLIADYKANH